ncbi:MAG: sigma 54-interacting transcriptional regulator [Polyangiaceae bacterium]
MSDGNADPVTRLVERTQSVPVVSAELRVIDGPDRGLVAEVGAQALRVGTGAGCQLRLTDPTVSRLHCELRARDDELRLRDTGSTNGTFVDGVRVYDAAIGSGASIRVGSTVLRVELAREPMHVQVSERTSMGELLGTSVALRRVYTLIERAAASQATVLIEGETGTGKELVARAVHAESARRDRPFVAVDCGAIADGLIESELFGHVRGAFSGAVQTRAGLFEEAAGGTLFLDEVGELPLALQPKLLRVLERREVRRVGANASTPVDVRVLAATNRSLAESVNEGSFREDLFYRLSVFEIALPPLRARREDIAVLARHYYSTFADVPMPESLLPSLLSRGWPGNVRELRNFIERTVAMGYSGSEPAPLPAPSAALESAVPVHLPLKEARVAWSEQFELLYARAILARGGGNVTRAAELAGINRRTLQRMLARVGVNVADDD